MPQGERTPAEKVNFQHMLSNINLLYLGCHVLVLLDLSYLSRFWVCSAESKTSKLSPPPYANSSHLVLTRLVGQTQFEAWTSMQTTTEGGLKSCPSVDDKSNRCTIVPIYNANTVIAGYLRTMWANKTPNEAYDILKQEDVTVTNQSDKDNQLPKIQKLAEEVRQVMRDQALPITKNSSALSELES